MRSFFISLVLMLAGTASITTASNLPFNDINILVVTDVHSWVASRSRHEPEYNADYGNVVSFFRLLREQHVDNDLFFVMNGDFMDGTGLSTYPPTYLTPILQRMPWDALNIGNHELYQNSTVEHIRDHFVDAWDGRYLTSNVLLESTHRPIGSRYRILHGKHTSLLTFGFLYNMANYCGASIVEPVEEVVQSDWFLAALRSENYDAIIVLAHMDYQDDLVKVIRDAIRNISSAPIQFITGHSHIRAFTAVDDASTSFEAGHYLDTVGFVSFPKMTAGLLDGVNMTNEFKSVFINASIDAFKSVLELDSIDTSEGLELSQFIQSTREEMGLFEILGCSPLTFDVEKGLNEPDSLWRLYVEQVMADYYLQSSLDSIFLQGTGAFRASLFAGEVNVDDLMSVSPFNDEVYLVDTKIEGSLLLKMMGGQPNQVFPGSTYALPRFASSLNHVEPNLSYHLYTASYDLRSVLEALGHLTDSTITASIQHFDDGSLVTTTTLWRNYIESHWKVCPTSMFHGNVPLRWIPVLAAILLAGVVLMIRWYIRLRRKRQGFRTLEAIKELSINEMI